MSWLLLPLAYVGCGAGLGAWLARRRGEGRDEGPQGRARGEAPGPPRPASPKKAAAAEATASAGPEEKWLNGILELLWPRINAYVEQLVQERLVHQIDQALPQRLQGALRLERLSLGRSTPCLHSFHLRQRGDEAIVLDLTLDVESDLDVEFKVMQMPVGLQRLCFHGVLTVCLGPASAKPPFFAGLELYFANAPELTVDFTGLAGVAQLAAVKGAIYSAIGQAIANAMVIPARIAVDLTHERDVAELKCPEPVGVLRLLVKSGEGLRSADIALAGGSSDPYVCVALGQQAWQSGVVPQSLAPVWTSSNVADFLVYDLEQVASVKVYDFDQLKQDDLLGEARIADLPRVAAAGRGVVDEVLQLVGPEGGPEGSLRVSMRWFRLSEEVPVGGIDGAVARGPSQLLLRATLQDVVGALPDMFTPPFFVRLSVILGDSTERMAVTSGSSHCPVQAAVSAELRRVCGALAGQGLPPARVAELTGLSPDEVAAALVQEQGGPTAAGPPDPRKNPIFRQALRVLLPWTSEMMAAAAVRLELVDRQQRRVCNFVEEPLASVAGKEWRGPFSLSSKVALTGSVGVRWLCMPS